MSASDHPVSVAAARRRVKRLNQLSSATSPTDDRAPLRISEFHRVNSTPYHSRRVREIPVPACDSHSQVLLVLSTENERSEFQQSATVDTLFNTENLCAK